MTAPVGLGSPAARLEEASGWASQLDMAAATRRRVVIHGGVLDRVLLAAADGSVRAVSMAEWLQRRLTSRHHFERIISYNHCEAPRVLAWGEVELVRAQQELDRRFAGQQDPADRVVVLPVLADFLRQDSRNVVILENAGYRFGDPGLEAVMIRHLARESAGAPPPLARSLSENSGTLREQRERNR